MDGFLADFTSLVELAQARQTRVQGGTGLLDLLSDHLGEPAETLPVLVEDIPAHRFADLDIAMGQLAAADPDYRLVGIGGGDQRHHVGLSDLLQQSRVFAQFPLGQPDFMNLAVGPGAQRQVVALGVHVFTYDGAPVAVVQRAANPRYGRTAAALEVLGGSPEAAAALLADIGVRLKSQSVIKGQVVTLTIDEYGSTGSGVTFHQRPSLPAADVILPDGLLEKVTTHAIHDPGRRALLRRYGQHLKRGILLHGPPGTGKTHTVKYLLGRTEGTTAIILSGNSLAFITEAAAMARALQPSLVILEDCDLIAGARGMGQGPQPLLFAVLEAMDGLDDDADVAFVLTTNRPDLLERALAQRPGRVDLAVEIPLPAERERKALLTLYARKLPFTDAALDRVAARTEGTTASFARELVRRAVILAGARDTANDGGDPADSHLDAAAAEMMADGQALTRSLLGSNPELAAGDAGAVELGTFGYVPGPGM